MNAVKRAAAAAVAVVMLFSLLTLSACRRGNTSRSGSSAPAGTNTVSATSTSGQSGKNTPSKSAGKSGGASGIKNSPGNGGNTAVPSEKAEIPRSFKAGETYGAYYHIEQTLDQTSGGTANTTYTTVDANLTVTIDSADPQGGISMTAVLTGFGVTSSSNGITESYDSNGGGGAKAPAYLALKGVGLNFSYDANGSFTGFGGLDGAYGRIPGLMSEYDDIFYEQLKIELENFYGMLDLPEMLGGHIAALPGRVVTSGEPWQANVTDYSGFAAVTAANYTFQGSREDNFVIGVTGAINSGLVVSPSSYAGASRIFNISGSISGEILAGKSRTTVQTGTLTRNFSGSVDISIPDDGYYGSMPVGLSSTTSFRLNAL